MKAHPAHVELSHRLSEIALARVGRGRCSRGHLRWSSGYQAGVDLVASDGIARRRRSPVRGGGPGPVAPGPTSARPHPGLRRDGHGQPCRRDARRRRATSPRSRAGSSARSPWASASSAPSPGCCSRRPGTTWRQAVAEALAAALPQPKMLTPTIADSVAAGLAELEAAGATTVGMVEPRPGRLVRARRSAERTGVELLQPGSRLLDECFGPVAWSSSTPTSPSCGRRSAALPGSLAATRDRRRRRTTRTRAGWWTPCRSRPAGSPSATGRPASSWTWAQHPRRSLAGDHRRRRRPRSVPRPWTGGCGRSTYQSVADAWLPTGRSGRRTRGGSRAGSTAVSSSPGSPSHDAAPRRPARRRLQPGARRTARDGDAGRPRRRGDQGGATRRRATTRVHWGPPWTENSSSYFECANRSKESVTLDLGDAGRPAGSPGAWPSRADVVVENFMTGALARRGLDYDAVARDQPRCRVLLDHRLRQRRRAPTWPATTSSSRRWAG